MAGIGLRLRTIRRQWQLSLREVEEQMVVTRRLNEGVPLPACCPIPGMPLDWPLHGMRQVFDSGAARFAGVSNFNVGQWKRAWVYQRPKKSFEDAVLRECRAVREGVGMMDVSTLGKIDVQGTDAALFLDRIYTNAFSTLKTGHSRPLRWHL